MLYYLQQRSICAGACSVCGYYLLPIYYTMFFLLRSFAYSRAQPLGRDASYSSLPAWSSCSMVFYRSICFLFWFWLGGSRSSFVFVVFVLYLFGCVHNSLISPCLIQSACILAGVALLILICLLLYSFVRKGLIIYIMSSSFLLE
jgi:hypothetical protein